MTQPEEELSEEGLRIVNALLPPREAEMPPSDEALLRFVLGWDDEAERAEILDRLTRSASLRQRLLAVRREVEDGSARTFPVVRRALDTLVQATRRWRAQGIVDAQDRILASIQRGVAPPTSDLAFAAYRGALPLTLAFQGDDLLAEAIVGEGEEPLELVLDDPLLGPTPLGAARPIAGRWSLRVPGFGSRYPETALDRLRLGPTREPSLLLASGEAVRLACEPRVEGGKLIVTFANSEFRGAGETLTVSLRVGPLAVFLGRAEEEAFRERGVFECAVDADDGPVPSSALVLAFGEPEQDGM